MLVALSGCGGNDASKGEQAAGAPVTVAPVQTVPPAAVASPGNQSEVDKAIAGDLERNIGPHRATQYGQRVYDIRVGGGVARAFTSLPVKNERTRQYASYICAAAYGPKGKGSVPGLKELHVVLRGGRRSLACDALPVPQPAS